MMVSEFLLEVDYFVYTAEFRSGRFVISEGPGYIAFSGDIELGVTGVASGYAYCETVRSRYLACFILVRAVAGHYRVACPYGLCYSLSVISAYLVRGSPCPFWWSVLESLAQCDVIG